MVDATEVIEQSEQEKQEVYSYVDDVAEYFIDRVGELFEADEAVQDVSDEFGVSQRVASQILRELYSDIVDPVVRVPRGGTYYVGVVEYVERDGWYGYIHYDDVDGQMKRGVCAKDVLEGVKDSEVGYADRDPSVEWSEIDEVFEEYYNDAYPDVDRSEVEVEVGASLLSGTTVGGNTVSIDGHDHTGETINPNTVNTEELNNNPATVMWGDSGDLVLLDSVNFGTPLEVSTQSTEYTRVVGNSASERQIASVRTPGIDMANFDRIYAELVGYRIDDQNDTGDNVYASFTTRNDIGVGDVEIVIFGDNNFRESSGLVDLSDIGVSIDDLNNPDSFQLHAKVDDSDAEILLQGGWAVYLWGEIA